MKTVSMTKVLESIGQGETNEEEKKLRMRCAKFQDLSKKERLTLANHYFTEFGIGLEQAIKDYNACSDVERALHLDAAMNGYI